MEESLKKEIEELIVKLKLDCSIEQFQDKVNWYNISHSQKLSEQFIENFQDKVDWTYISHSQKLSEQFIEKFQDKVDWYRISTYQKLSEQFIEKYKLNVSDKNWLYKTNAEKLIYIKINNLPYELVDDKYIIAYKTIRSDNYSVYNFQYQYFSGNLYEAHCNCNTDNENSFGLSAWTKEEAITYHSTGKLLKVKIYIEDIGCFVHENNKIRCHKFEVIEEVK